MYIIKQLAHLLALIPTLYFSYHTMHQYLIYPIILVFDHHEYYTNGNSSLAFNL